MFSFFLLSVCERAGEGENTKRMGRAFKPSPFGVVYFIV